MPRIDQVLTVRLVLNALVGALIAVAVKGREMTATMTLALLGMLLAIQATLTTAAKTGDYGMAWTLPHTFAFSIAIVAAGAIVRTYRARATTPPAVG